MKECELNHDACLKVCFVYREMIRKKHFPVFPNLFEKIFNKDENSKEENTIRRYCGETYIACLLVEFDVRTINLRTFKNCFINENTCLPGIRPGKKIKEEKPKEVMMPMKQSPLVSYLSENIFKSKYIKDENSNEENTRRSNCGETFIDCLLDEFDIRIVDVRINNCTINYNACVPPKPDIIFKRKNNEDGKTEKKNTKIFFCNETFIDCLLDGFDVRSIDIKKYKSCFLKYTGCLPNGLTSRAVTVIPVEVVPVPVVPEQVTLKNSEDGNTTTEKPLVNMIRK